MVWFGVSNKQREVAEVKRSLKRSGNLEERIVRMEGEGITHENMGALWGCCKQGGLGVEREMGFCNKRE